MANSRQIVRNSAALERAGPPVTPFVAHAPGQQDPDVHRQFVDLQRRLEAMQRQLDQVSAVVGDGTWDGGQP